MQKTLRDVDASTVDRARNARVGSPEDSARTPRDHNPPALDNQHQQGYGDFELWSAYGQQMGVWPPGLTRLFGNAAFQDTSNGEGHVQ